MNPFFPYVILFFLYGCSSPRLQVQTQYFTNEDLASYHVGTPDPTLDSEMVGQRLLIQWSLSPDELANEDVTLRLVVRFRNREEKTVEIPIHKESDYFLYTVMNEMYCEKGGILTYYVEVRSETSVLASWKHPLWVPLIVMNTQDEHEKLSNCMKEEHQ